MPPTCSEREPPLPPPERTLEYDNLRRVDLQRVGGNLRERCPQALAHRLGTAYEAHALIGFDGDVDFLGQQAASGHLDVVGDGMSQKHSPARRVGFARVESGPVDRFHCFAEQGLEGARFISRVRRIGVRHLLRSDKVPALEIDRIEAQLERGLVHQALDQEAHFRTACAAVGIDRRGICKQHPHFMIDERNVVAAVRRPRAGHCRHRRTVEGKICAHVGE